MSERHTVIRHEVTSILPGDGWEAVLRDDNGVEFACPIDFIGSALEHRERFDGQGTRMHGDNRPMSAIVGIVIDDDGCDDIVNEYSNFVRLRRKVGTTKKADEA